ncbi:MAG: amino acid dehydrogenase, partial [Lentisphaerae bacterium]|nr:amino acid dehydrogenase [Lentisphaerota bacterium]
LLFVSGLDGFNPEKLRGEGARIAFSQPVIHNGERCNRVVERIEGKLVEHLVSRDDFMLLFQNNLTNYAEVFVPAGGRPGTINEDNWQNFFPDGKASFRAIVEGANAYITPGARLKIQQNGVWVVKDASANKCGVITSSYEIISGLMLDEDEFKTHKRELISQIMEILQQRASQEAEWLYSHFQTTGVFLTDLTEKLSRSINAAKVEISAFLARNPHFISNELLLSHLPALFKQRFPERVQRLPLEYRQAIVAVELACRLVYTTDSTNMENKLRLLLTAEEKAQS